MVASGFPSNNLAQLSLRQLRELASQLGVGRYSRLLKQQLVWAIQSRASQGEPEPGAAVLAAAASEPPSPGAQAPSLGDQAPSLGAQPLNSGSDAPSLQALEAKLPPAPRPEGETRVVFLPRDPQWAYVFWQISAADRSEALAGGGEQLALRVMDVTGRNGGTAHPHTLQEVVVDGAAHEWYVPVPLSDRDYRVELGFRKTGGGWISLAISAAARMPSSEPVEAIADQFVPFSLDTFGSTSPSHGQPVSMPAAELHERIYQQASGGHRSLGRGSEAFQDLDARHRSAAGQQRSGVGLWASGRSDSGAGRAARQRDFWLVADAELIVYGATDPNATLHIGEEVIPLSPEGTFQVQVPFRDGEQHYPITALAADREQQRSITLAFRRTTPEANTNSREDSVAEWF